MKSERARPRAQHRPKQVALNYEKVLPFAATLDIRP
jgi:hypothetical protein